MDVQMPDMDGFEATAAIRENEKKTGQHTPVIAMTAHAMAGDRQRCLAAGMDGYLSKPIQTEELFAVIENLARNPKEVPILEATRS
jgi:CheY-like chemotaxis protein